MGLWARYMVDLLSQKRSIWLGIEMPKSKSNHSSQTRPLVVCDIHMYSASIEDLEKSSTYLSSMILENFPRKHNSVSMI